MWLYWALERLHLWVLCLVLAPPFRKDLETLEHVQRRQQGWWGAWNTSPMRNGWGSWGCSAWRKGDSGVTLSLSTTAWKVAVVRGWSLTKEEDIALSCPQVNIGWILGKIFYRKSDKVLGLSSWRGGGVTITDHVYKKTRYGTQCHGLFEVLEHGLDSMILKISSNLVILWLCDSVILWIFLTQLWEVYTCIHRLSGQIY